MVRAGVVDHPAEWKWSGYHEIQKPKIRYRLIDHRKLMQFLNVDNYDALAKTHRRWVESQLKKRPERQGHFSASIAVDGRSFIQKVPQSLGAKGVGRRMTEAPVAGYQLKESMAKYGSSTLDPADSHQPVSSVANTIPWR